MSRPISPCLAHASRAGSLHIAPNPAQIITWAGQFAWQPEVAATLGSPAHSVYPNARVQSCVWHWRGSCHLGRDANGDKLSTGLRERVLCSRAGDTYMLLCLAHVGPRTAGHWHRPRGARCKAKSLCMFAAQCAHKRGRHHRFAQPCNSYCKRKAHQQPLQEASECLDQSALALRMPHGPEVSTSPQTLPKS